MGSAGTWKSIGTTRTKKAGSYRLRVKLAVGAWELRGRVGTRGVVSDPVQVSAAGRVRKTKLRRATVALPARRVAQVAAPAADGSQVLTLRAGTALPKVGRVVTMNASAVAPAGVLGRVVSVDRARGQVVLGPAALSEAYSVYRVSTVATLGEVVASASVTPALRAQALQALAASFHCVGVVKNPLTFATVDLSSLRLDSEFDMGRPYLSLLLLGAPKFHVGIKLGAAVEATCTATLPSPPIPLGPSGLTMDLAPQISMTVSSGAATEFALNAEGRLAVGFTKLGNQPVVYTKALRLAGEPTGSVTQTSKVSAKLGASVAMGIMVGGRVGVYGQAGPSLLAELSTRNGAQCRWLGDVLDFGVGVKADAFVAQWKWELVAIQWKLPTIYDVCDTSPPGTPPGSPAPPTATQTPTPPPGTGPIRIARTSGPAGFTTDVSTTDGSVLCPAAGAGTTMLEVHLDPQGNLRSWGDTIFSSTKVWTDWTSPVGTWTWVVQCREVVDPTLNASVAAGTVVRSIPVPLTITGPALTAVVHRDPQAPRSYTISDGGGCGPGSWLDINMEWASGGTPEHVTATTPVSADGHWGPVNVTLPVGGDDPPTSYAFLAACQSAPDDPRANSFILYSSTLTQGV